MFANLVTFLFMSSVAYCWFLLYFNISKPQSVKNFFVSLTHTTKHQSFKVGHLTYKSLHNKQPEHFLDTRSSHSALKQLTKHSHKGKGLFLLQPQDFGTLLPADNTLHSKVCFLFKMFTLLSLCMFSLFPIVGFCQIKKCIDTVA
jgi:hypothetical protein